MLKRKITKSDYDALPDAVKEHYKANGADYVLEADDAHDLITARDKEKRDRETAQGEVRTLRQKIADLEANGSGNTQEIDTLRQQLTEKDNQIKAISTELTGAKRQIICGPVADKIASRFSVPSLIKDKVLNRLDYDPKTGEPVVLDAHGKVSPLKIDQLESEFVDNAEFKAIVIASKGSGSAAKPYATGSATQTPQNTQQPAKPLAKMTPAEFAAHRKAQAEAGDNS